VEVRNNERTRSQIVHVLIPALAKFERRLGGLRKMPVMWRHAPCGHERKHDKRATHRRVILITTLGSVPLGQAKNFDEKDTKEHEKDKPQ
jgi:hypothetical protein